MKKRRKTPRKSSYKFSDKKHSRQGIISTLISFLCILSIIVLIVITTNSAGNSDLIVGLIGDIIFLISIVGFFIAIAGFREKDIYLTYPIIGAGLNSLTFVTLLALFLVGTRG